MQQQTTVRRGRIRRIAAVVTAALMVVAVAGTTAVSAKGNWQRPEKADVMVQGGGEVYQSNGAKLRRTDHSLEVTWRVKTPKPGTYTYPSPDQVPPGAPVHPPIAPGYPEVFTLWLFSFDHPELCSDGVCDGNDLGDTPARGNVYQLDGEIATGWRLKMSGKVRLGQTPANGLGLSNPEGAEVHVAMAPHGAARDGADLIRQLNSAVGGPPQWFAAVFD